MLRSAASCLLLVLACEAAAAPGFRLGGIAFEPCDIEPRGAARVKAQCAKYSVPENHAETGGRRIELRVALIEARSKRPLPDPVLFLAGGPGQSAVEAYPGIAAALAPLARNRHVLLVDQRGTGESNPLRCPLPDWKEGTSFSVDTARQQARACLKRHRDRADPRLYTTSDYIRDLELVRQALAIAELNVIGGSYGTRVALEYLRRHPDAVRSVFIDSVVPPELALLQDHAINLEDALRAMAGRCSGSAACGGRFGDVHATLRDLLRKTRLEPRQVTIPDPASHRPLTVPFNPEALLWVARFFSYSPEAASLMPLLLHEAAAGYPQSLLAQVEMLSRSLPDELAHGMELSVICAEDADLLQVRPQDRETVMGAEAIDFIRAQCEEWPHGTRPDDFKQPVVSDKPVLLLSGEYDPVTPPRYAVQVAKTLSRSRTLVAKGQGHTPMNKGCMPRLLKKFVDDLDPAALDVGCLEVLGDTPFFLGYEGPAP